MFNQSEKSTFSMSDVKFVKRIQIGNLDPNNPMSDKIKTEQMELLNKCLEIYPKGKLIGKDVGFAIYQLGEHQITMQVTTYHIGFSRKPYWLE